MVQKPASRGAFVHPPSIPHIYISGCRGYKERLKESAFSCSQDEYKLLDRDA